MVRRMTRSADSPARANGSPSSSRGVGSERCVEVVCIGETLLDMLPSRTGRRLRDAGAFNPTLGGSPANTSVWLSRLGVGSALVTRIGADEFGQICMRELTNAGVDTRSVSQDPNLKTGLCFLQIDEDGERSFFGYRSETAEIHFGPQDIDESLLAQAKVVHLCPAPMKLPAGREAILGAAQVARANGVIVSADCNLRPKHWNSIEDAREAGWALARCSDVLKLNEDEAELIVGSVPPQAAAKRLLEEGPQLVVVTLGSQGAVWATGTDEGHVQAPKVRAVDATGCGDAWVAGLLARIKDRVQHSVEERFLKHLVVRAVEDANRLGAAVATVYGATTPIASMPD